MKISLFTSDSYDMIGYLKTVAQADVDYAKSLEMNLGVYQQAWRQGIYNGLTPGDPSAGLWQTEIAFAGKVADARNMYMTGLGNASMTYTNTTLDAYSAFNTACWDASDSYYNGMVGVSSAYSSSMRTANRMFATASFNADKSHTMAMFSAAKTESLANAAADYTIAQSNAAAAKNAADSASDAIDDLMSNLGNVGTSGYDFNNWLNEASTTNTTLTTLKNTEYTARQQRISAGSQQLANLKSQNALTRKDAESTANATYQNASELANVNYALSSFSAATTYINIIASLEHADNNSKENAINTLISTVDIATNKYNRVAGILTEAYFSAIDQLNIDPNFDPAGYINGAGNTANSGGTVQPMGNCSKPPKDREWGKDSGWWWANPWSYPVFNMLPNLLAGNSSIYFVNKEFEIREAQRPLWEHGRELGQGSWQYDIYYREYYQDVLKGATAEFVIALACFDVSAYGNVFSFARPNGSFFLKDASGPRTGSVVIEKGADPEAKELAIGNIFKKNGFDVIFRETASHRGIQGVKTSDTMIKGIGRVEIYKPENLITKTIARGIEGKNVQADIIAVDANISRELMLEVANSVWGKQRCKNIKTIIFVVGDELFEYTRPLK